jgi:hypothetical protein
MALPLLIELMVVLGAAGRNLPGGARARARARQLTRRARCGECKKT